MAANDGTLKQPGEKLIHKARFIEGAIALIMIIEYLVTEAVAALAWKNPVYSYSNNYISDLGVSGPPVTFMGRLIYSPLYWVMNAGFFVEGVLAVLAAFLLMPLFTKKTWRTIIPLIAILHGVGITLVAIFHGSADATKEYTGVMHVTGAALAIIFGNVQCICAGIAAGQSGAPKWFTAYSVVLGLAGLIALFCPFIEHGVAPGTMERVAVDSFITWDITTGIFLLVGARKFRRIMFQH